MSKIIGLVAMAALLGATVPAMAGTAKFNAQSMQRVTPDAHSLGKKSAAPLLAYYYTRGFGTDRSVNVLSFSTPSTGIYCIQPIKAVNLTAIYPLVSVEWSTSLGESFSTFWVDTSLYTDCPTGDLEVRTYDISTPSAPALSANISFDIVVP